MKQAIILAAGMGTRLQPYTKTEHKCMTRVNGTPIIYNTLNILEKCGIDEVIIVVGYLKEQVKQQITKLNLKIKINFVDNDEYVSTNTIYSLQKALHSMKCISDEIYIIEGDVFFEQSVIKSLMDCQHENATVLEPYNEKLEGSFVELNDRGYLIDWCHKTDQDENYILTNKYKTVNIHKFNNDFVNNILVDRIDKVIEEKGKNIPMEKLFRAIVLDNRDLIWGDILNKQKWFEIDDIYDLKIAEEIFN